MTCHAHAGGITIQDKSILPVSVHAFAGALDRACGKLPTSTPHADPARTLSFYEANVSMSYGCIDPVDHSLGQLTPQVCTMLPAHFVPQSHIAARASM
jgi:hypothetical protein